MTQNFEKYEQQLDRLRSELAEQREAREKSEKLFIQTCDSLKSGAESLKLTIERLQSKLQPVAAARDPPIQLLDTLDIVEPFSGAAPPAVLAMPPRHESALPPGGGGFVYLPLAGDASLAEPPSDPVKDAMAAARFRRMLGGRMQRGGSAVWP